MRVTVTELEDLAHKCGMFVQHDCGGFRLVQRDGAGNAYVYPDGGICPTATKRECMIFLRGYEKGWKETR